MSDDCRDVQLLLLAVFSLGLILEVLVLDALNLKVEGIINKRPDRSMEVLLRGLLGKLRQINQQTGMRIHRKVVRQIIGVVTSIDYFASLSVCLLQQ